MLTQPQQYHRNNLSCLSWKWRKRSSVKITERTHEEATEALHAFHQNAASEWQPSLHSAWDAAALEDALRLVEGYVEHYNNVRLNSAIGYITPKDMLAGRQQEIQAERDRKLDAAREQRKNRRQRTA